MPIFIGTSVKNQQQISLGGNQMGKVYVGDKLVWEKPSGIVQIKYGLLYNWYAATNTNKISSSDNWEIGSLSEWASLITYLGGFSIAGGLAKETGTIYWYPTNSGATNSAKFNMRGGGYRQEGGTFTGIGAAIEFNTSTDYFGIGHNFAYALGNSTLFSADAGIRVGYNRGQYIRLKKTSTTLTDGQTGTYTGNDGKVYRTICIGTQEWLADNLAETKYRNGNTIPEVTDNSAWAALTTGALCVYNNNWSNV